MSSRNGPDKGFECTGDLISVRVHRQARDIDRLVIMQG